MRAFAVAAGSLLFAAAIAPARPASPESWPALTFHKAPRPLADGAVTSDWPRFLGTSDTPVSPETKLDHTLPPEGPAKVWEVRKGTGYACPAIVRDKLVLFHRIDDREIIDCLEAETGKRFWSHSYSVVYSDRYGYSDGPRAGPVIDGDRVFVFGVTAVLTCLDLGTGSVIWQREAAKTDKVPKYFFGTGTSPLVHGDNLIVDLGGADGRDIAAFDKTNGSVRWFAKSGWGQSYASPIAATLREKERVLVFQGGEGSEAMNSIGGLVCIDPLTGKIDDKFFWRAPRYTSVNASSPVACGADRVFITQAYNDSDSPSNGGAMVELTDAMKFREVWKDERLACHWMTPVLSNGHLYAFSGEKERECELVCYDASNGKCQWRTKVEHDVKLPDGRSLSVGLLRGSLLETDGAFLALGEWGTLAWLELSPGGCKKTAAAQLFTAPYGAWTLPALSRGLLYVCQNEEDRITGAPRRLICYDLRGK